MVRNLAGVSRSAVDARKTDSECHVLQRVKLCQRQRQFCQPPVAGLGRHLILWQPLWLPVQRELEGLQAESAGQLGRAIM